MNSPNDPNAWYKKVTIVAKFLFASIVILLGIAPFLFAQKLSDLFLVLQNSTRWSNPLLILSVVFGVFVIIIYYIFTSEQSTNQFWDLFDWWVRLVLDKNLPKRRPRKRSGSSLSDVIPMVIALFFLICLFIIGSRYIIKYDKTFLPVISNDVQQSPSPLTESH